MELGFRDSAIVRHFVELLFQAGRGNEALEFYSQIPALVQLTGELELRASQKALANRDFRQAEQLRGQAVEANPLDFKARLWLARVLMEDRRRDDAEAEIREGIAVAQADPDRWLSLVRFAVLTASPPRPRRSSRRPRPTWSSSRWPWPSAARSWAAPTRPSTPDRAKSWFDQARHWFGQAQAEHQGPR